MFPNILHKRSTKGMARDIPRPKSSEFESYIRYKLMTPLPREPLPQASPTSTYVTDRPPPYEPQPLRRLPVGEATLYAYAAMRGGLQLHDPLHQTLYAYQNPYYHDLASLHRAADHTLTFEGVGPRIFWWEKPVSAPPQEQGKPRSGYEEYDGNSAPTKRHLFFREHQLMHPPQPKSNHYRGEHAHQEYGYIPINGIWADPDSSGSLDLASKHLYEPGMKLPPSPYPPLPSFFTGEEEDALYKDYVDFVTDDVDMDGDPRDMRITPRVFALWAEGARRTNSYVETIIEPQEIWSTAERRDRQNNRIRKPRSRVRPQYDIETGSCFSGICETDETPSLLVTEDGVEPMSRPPNFHRMLPQVDIDLDRAIFGGYDQVEEWLRTNGPSLEELREYFTLEAARNALADGDSQRGIDMVAHVQEKVTKNIAGTLDLVSSYHETGAMYMNGESRKKLLDQQIFFLKRHLDNLTPHRSMRKNTFKRLLREQLDRSIVVKNGISMMCRDASEKAKKTMADVKELERERDFLLKKIGVSSVNEVHGLIPSPSYHPREEIQRRFGG